MLIRRQSFKNCGKESCFLWGARQTGKSTLLKIISRIIEPSGGRVLVNGRVGSLLEVGTGFHPELTGCVALHRYFALKCGLTPQTPLSTPLDQRWNRSSSWA